MDILHLLLPLVNRRTDCICSYYIKTFCHTSCCSSLLLTDRQITLAHITPRHSATPLAAPPVNGQTDYTCTFVCSNWCLGEGHPGGCLESSLPRFIKTLLSIILSYHWTNLMSRTMVDMKRLIILQFFWILSWSCTLFLNFPLSWNVHTPNTSQVGLQTKINI